MNQTLQVEDAPLTDDDILLLRKCSRGRLLMAGFGVFVVLLLALAVLTFIALGLSEWRTLDFGVGAILLAAITVMGALAVFFGRKLLRIPRGWRSLDRALKGRLAKQIVSGRLTSFGPGGSTPGVCYGFGEQRVEAALPFWNEIASDTRSGHGPATAVGLTDLPVRLHLLTLQPDAPAVLLRAEYPMSAESLVAVEEISDADRAAVRREELDARKFMLIFALVPLVGGLFLPPLLFVAAIFAILAMLFGMRSRKLKRGIYKHGVRGVVEEAVVYRLRSPNSSIVSLVHNYRIGGVMYRVEYLGDVVEPGRRVEFEFLDAGLKGQTGLFFRVDGEPAQA
ncbi:hypothetical protein [Achromobacter sp.]|uniref:hypothetical protein n=1 Tax=Achromobacter sp. TaxID=134375 RepID=UPI002F94D05F